MIIYWQIKCSRCDEQVRVDRGIDPYIPMLGHIYEKHGFSPYSLKKGYHSDMRSSHYRMKLVKNFFTEDAIKIE